MRLLTGYAGSFKWWIGGQAQIVCGNCLSGLVHDVHGSARYETVSSVSLGIVKGQSLRPTGAAIKANVLSREKRFAVICDVLDGKHSSGLMQQTHQGFIRLDLALAAPRSVAVCGTPVSSVPAAVPASESALS